MLFRSASGRGAADGGAGGGQIGGDGKGDGGVLLLLKRLDFLRPGPFRRQSRLCEGGGRGDPEQRHADKNTPDTLQRSPHSPLTSVTLTRIRADAKRLFHDTILTPDQRGCGEVGSRRGDPVDFRGAGGFSTPPPGSGFQAQIGRAHV